MAVLYKIFDKHKAFILRILKLWVFAQYFFDSKFKKKKKSRKRD